VSDDSRRHLHSRRAPTTGASKPPVISATATHMLLAFIPLLEPLNPGYRARGLLNLLVARCTGGARIIGGMLAKTKILKYEGYFVDEGPACPCPPPDSRCRPAVSGGRGARCAASPASPLPLPFSRADADAAAQLTVSSPVARRCAPGMVNPAAGGRTTPCLLRASRSSSASMENR
jgi:hypothetical protein